MDRMPIPAAAYAIDLRTSFRFWPRMEMLDSSALRSTGPASQTKLLPLAQQELVVGLDATDIKSVA